MTCDRSFAIIEKRTNGRIIYGGEFLAKDTREKILTAALEMFSQKGYEGTNLRELAASLGMGKSSMYRHFESKEEIWNALLDELITYYAVHFGSVEHLPPEMMDHLVQRIITEVPGINRVLYDFTPKPPATVEYE